MCYLLKLFLGMVGICESQEYLLSQDILLQFAEMKGTREGDYSYLVIWNAHP